MSTLTVNTLKTTDGLHEIDVSGLAAYPLSSAWDGIVLDETTTPKLSDIPTNGTNPEAKLYPDGSIVGSTDTGNFTMWANGDAEWESLQTGVNVTATIGALFGSGSKAVSFPLSLLSSYGATVRDSSSPNIWGTARNDGTSAQLISYGSFTSRAMIVCGRGRWK